jgi:DNA-binding MarR family transcriptional regulator
VGLQTPDHSARQQKVLRQFRRIFNSLKTHLQRAESTQGLGGAQIWALSVVAAQPGLGMNALAQAMDVRQPTASNLVRLLAKQGFVEVHKKGADRRSVQLHLLPRAKTLLQHASGPFEGALPMALHRLDNATLRRLDQDLTAVMQALAHH